MSKSHLETRVGVFVGIALVVLAGMMILFSKGASFDWNKYELRLRAVNIGGLKRNASVLMAGVRVGSVAGMQLGPGATNVIISLKIDDRIAIHRDARFSIEQSGFLGDPYVAIVPTRNVEPLLKPGDTVECLEPFNLLEMARNAADFLTRVDGTAAKLDDAVADLRRVVLNDVTLSNLAETIGNLRTASANAMVTVDNVNTLVVTNRGAVALSLSNLSVFSERISQLADGLNEIAATNSPDISLTIKNFEASSESLKNLLGGLGEGPGLVHTLFNDQQTANHFSLLASNLSVTSSNLNRLGLWGILWEHKPPRTNPWPPPSPIYTGRDPRR